MQIKVVAILIILVSLSIGLFIFYLFPRPEKEVISPQPVITPTPIPTPASFEFESFEKMISKLNTPQEIIQFLSQNFKLIKGERKAPLLPKQLFEKKEGTAFDFAIFTSYLLWYHKFEATILHYAFEKEGKKEKNAIVVFRDIDAPKTIYFEPSEISFYLHGYSFREALEKEEQRLGAKIIECAISYWTDKGELWPGEWRKKEEIHY